MSPRLLSAVLSAIFLSLAASVLAAGEEHQSVVVMHSYQDNEMEGEYFRTRMAREFRRHGLRPEIHHIYMDFPYNNKGHFEVADWKAIRDSINAYSPDIILLNDDFCIDWLFYRRTDREIFSTVPSVFAGVSVLPKDSLSRYPLMTGFSDPVDLPTNASVYYELTGSHNVVIEIEKSHSDSLLYKDLRSQITDTTKFVDDYDFHMKALNENYFKKFYPGKMVFDFISSYDPYANAGPEDDDARAVARTHSIYRHANHNHQLQVKYDIFSSSIADRSRSPQPSCIREQFGNKGHVRVLGGYFADLDTQIRDEVDYAVLILRGTDPAMLPVGTHDKNFFLDYDAMQRTHPPLEYRDYRDKYHIINVPFKVAHRGAYYTLLCLLLLVSALSLVYLSYRALHSVSRMRDILVRNLMRENEIRNLSLSSNDACVWTLNDGTISFSAEFASRHGIPVETTVERFLLYAGEESRKTLGSLFFDVSTPGQSRKGRFSLKDPNTGDIHWWEVSFTTGSGPALRGIIINVDEAKAAEDAISDALDKVNEVHEKEEFIAAISDDIRRPLDAVIESSRQLSRDDLTPDELRSNADMIMSGTSDILSMIDDIVNRKEGEDKA